MAYEGPEYWYVIYKAVADFGDLMRDAAKAKSELQSMADSVKAETAAEVAGATQAAQARKTDVMAIQQESQALAQLANAAKNTNVQLLYGGRNDMQQHLSDMAQELQFTTLLNRQQWLGFSTVQQAVAYRQQMLQLALQENKARFGGYLTPDQWLGYLQKEVSAYTGEAAAIRARAAAIQTETAAMLSYDNAVQGTHASIGQLGEGISAATGYAAALTGLPDEVITRLSIDDAGAMAKVAAYRAALGAIPGAESTSLITSALRAGGVPLSARSAPSEAPFPSLLPPAETDEVDALGAALAELAAREAAAAEGASVLRSELEADSAAAAVLADELRALTEAGDSAGSGGAAGFRTASGLESVSKEIVPRYIGELEAIPAEIVTEAEFEDSQATDELHAWVGDLVAAVRDRYAFYAQFDDTEMLEKLKEDQAKIKAAAAGWEGDLGGFTVLGMGGGAGGGGGGAPPPAAAAPGGDDEAARVLADELAALRAEEAQAGDQADVTAGDFLRMAAAADSGAKSYAYFRAAVLAARLAQGDGTDEARASAQEFLNLAAEADSGARAYSLVQAAGMALGAAERAVAAGAQDAARGISAVGGAIPLMVDGLIKSTGGWFGLNSQLRLFGGLLPGVTGHVAAWHILLDSIVETLAVVVPALITLFASLGAYAAGASDSFRAVYERIVAVHTASDAFDQTIAPMTGRLEALHNQLRPEVWELYGDAIDVVHQKTGLFNQLATQTSSVLDRLAARVVVDMSSSAHGLETFFSVGSQDLAKIGQIFVNLGDALLALIKVTTETHIDQIFLNIFVALSKLLDLIAKLPTPVLAAAFALHAFWLWGGLLSTVVLQLLNPLRALALAISGVDAAVVEGGLASLGEDASAFSRLKAGLIDISAGFSALIGKLFGIGSAVKTAAADAGQAAGTVAVASGGEGLAGATAAGVAEEASAAASVGEATGLAAGFTAASFEEAGSKATVEAGFQTFTDRLAAIAAAGGAKVKAAFVAMRAAVAAVPDEVALLASAVANFTSPSAEELSGFVKNVQASGQSVQDLARGTSQGAAMLDKYGQGLDSAGQDAVALAAHSGASEAEIGKLASSLSEAGVAGAAAGTGADAAGAGLGTLLGIPVIGWLIALAAALIGVSVYLGMLPDKTQKWITSMDQALNSASMLTVINKTMGDLAATTAQLAQAQRTGTGNTTELANAQDDLSSKLGLELGHVGQVSRAYGTDMPTALALLQAAGVKTSDLFTAQGKVWASDLQQVKGLVDGYAAMGQGLTELQQAVTVQLVVSSDQYNAMQKLNQAYDTFQQLVGAPVSGVLALAQGLQSFTTDAKAAGASMLGLSGPSITLQQQFQTNYTDVETLFDSLRTSEAITGDGGFAGAVKDAVSALIPLAGNNKAAAAEISQLAQEAGGPATTNLQQLARWAGNVADPLDKLYKASQDATIGVSDLNADGARLTATLQQDLNPALASAAFNALGGQAALNAFATDMAKLGPNSQVTIGAGRTVAEMFLSIDKNSASAKAQFVGWLEAMGETPAQADKAWASVSRGVKPLAAVRDQIAKTGQAVEDLGKPGLWGQVEHQFLSLGDQVKAHPVAFALAGAFNFIPGVTTAMDAVGHAVTGFFGHTLPDLITQTIPDAAKAVAGFFAGPFAGAFTSAAQAVASFFAGPFVAAIQGSWAHVWSALVAPVTHAFDDVKNVITGGFDGWWAGHGKEVEEVWRAVWTVVSTVALYAWHKVEEDAKIFWSGLQSIFSWGGGLITGDAKILWSGLQTWWRAGASAVSAIWRVFWSGVTSTASQAWGIIGPVIRAGWSVITAIFKIAAGAVEAIGKVLWDTLAAAAELFWAGLVAAAKIGWDTLVAIFSVALDLITGHWSQAWTDIKNYGEQVWHSLSNFYTSAWSIFRNDFTQVLNQIKDAWSTTWGAIETAGKQIWGDIKAGFSSTVASIKTTWSSLEGIFRGPVSFLVNTVYDNGIAALWNDVMGAIGGPKLPIVKFAGGGQIPGYGGGDIVPAWIKGGGPALLEPGEAVVDKERTRKYAGVLKAMGVPGFQSGGGVPGGGVLHDIGSFFSGAAHDFGTFLGDTIDIGKIGLALLTGNTAALGNALEKFIGAGGASGELAQMITGIPKTIIKQLLSDAASVGKKAGATLAGPGGSATAGVETVARYIMAHGGTKEAGAGVGGVVSGESGGNPEILEFPNDPGSGGAGIIQWTPPSSAFPYQPIITGNVGRDMATQLADMLAYIDSRGGIGAINRGGVAGGPMGAAQVFSTMEAPAVAGSDIVQSVVMSLYAQGLASGGEVRVPYLAGLSAGRAHNVLTAAGLTPRADAGQKPTWWVSSSSPAGDATVSPHYGVWINASAGTKVQGIKVPDLAGYDAGTAHNILAAMGLTPTAPAGQKAAWQVTGTKPGRDTGTGYGAHVEIMASAPVTPGPPSAPGGLDAAQSWSYYAGKIAADSAAQKNAFWNLYNAKMPAGKAGATAAQAANWVKDKAVLWASQTIVGKDRDALLANLANPAQMTSAQWGALGPALADLKGLEYGSKDPTWNWPAWKYEFPLWQAANASTKTMQADVAAAYAAWQGTYGPGGPSSGSAPASEYTTPGVLVTVPGGVTSPVSLASLIVGGPAAAMYAGGGLVGADLGQVAGMFGMGGPSRDPALSALGLASGLQRQLVTATGGGGMPRTLAQGAGDRIGVKIGSLTISNPVAEKPSDTIARSTNRLAFLAGRGAV